MWSRYVRRAALALAAVLALTVGSVSRAETNYPDKPVRILVPYGPGGVADVSTRLVAQKLSEKRINNILAVLSKPLKYAVDCGAVRTSPEGGEV